MDTLTAEMNTVNKEEAITNAIQPRFDIQRLYVKEQSCKLPHGAASFQGEWKPEVQLEMNIKQERLTANQYQTTLRLTLTTKNQQQTAFLLEVQQAGIFVLEQIPDEHLPLLLNVHCPTILYPYARKVVADAVYAAGFPSIALAPINFEALYQQQQQAQTNTHSAAGNQQTAVKDTVGTH